MAGKSFYVHVSVLSVLRPVGSDAAIGQLRSKRLLGKVNSLFTTELNLSASIRRVGVIRLRRGALYKKLFALFFTKRGRLFQYLYLH